MQINNTKPGVRVEFSLGPWVDGINEKMDSGRLGVSNLRAAYNLLFDEIPGIATKRLGIKEVALLPSGLPARFGYVFKKNDGTEYLLLSDGAKIYKTTDLVTLTLLNTVADLDNTAYLVFETAENRCWIFNGTDYDMWYDGTNFVIMDKEYGNAVAATGDAGTDTTHIIDAHLTSTVADYWKFCKVVITSGGGVGGEAEVTAFDPATDKLTISPAITGLTTGSGYMVGLVMPKGRIARYALVNLFIGGTAENRSEVRFNRRDDPDTGRQMSLDNPRAWPPEYQLAITQDDGDQVWTFSPCYRNRVLVTKGTAIYRLESDSTFVFVPVLVTQEVGCRYPDSWAVKDEVLIFLGNERSGLLDLYVTDMVSVKPRHKDGRLLPSFQEMYRSEPAYKYIARASADQFNTGDKSTLCKTSGGRLECREISTKTDWDEIITVKTDSGVSEGGSVSIMGAPAWPQKYEAAALPAAVSPVWTKWVLHSTTESISGSELINSVGYAGQIHYFRNDVFDSSKNAFVALRLRQPLLYDQYSNYIQVQNGTKAITIWFEHINAVTSLYINGVYVSSYDLANYRIINILLDKNGSGSVYSDGARIWTGSAAAAAEDTQSGMGLNTICFKLTAAAAFTGASELDFIYEDADFGYTAAELSATLPTSGTVTVKIDYTRTPESFGQYFYTAVLNGGTVGVESQSSADDITYSALFGFSNGNVPGSTQARYLKIKFTLTRADVVNGPELQKLIGGFLWRMKAAQIGTNISAWRSFLAEITRPTYTALAVKARLATTLAEPIEANWGAWTTIANTNNIGTILSDVTFPVTAGQGRWIDIKVEGSPSSAGVTPNLENFLINWQEGSSTRLMVTSFVYKKRLYMTGVSSVAAANDRLFILDTNQAYSKFLGLAINKILSFRGLMYGLSSIDDKIFQMEVTGQYMDGTTVVDAYLEPGALDFGHQRFEVMSLKIGSVGISSSVAAYLSLDGIAWTLIGTAVFTTDGTKIIRVPRGWIGKKIFTRLRNAAGEGMAVSLFKVSGIVQAEER